MVQKQILREEGENQEYFNSGTEERLQEHLVWSK